MLTKYNTKGKIILFLASVALSGALIGGFILRQHYFSWLLNRNSFNDPSARPKVLAFLERTGAKARSEKVTVEKMGDDLGHARAVLVKKSNEGISVPGMLFLVGRRYILVGKLFDLETGKELSPDLFGRVPVTFDVDRLNLSSAHKRGSDHPKVLIVEYGDYGCQSCASLEKAWQPLLDNFPDVQHVYKHSALSDGGRYLAEVAEAVALHDRSKFWEIHRRFMSADKGNWDEKETRGFAHAQLKQIGLNPEQIEETIRKSAPGKMVSRDQGEFPVSQTPTLIVNGEVVVGIVSYDDLKRIVEEKLRSKQARESGSGSKREPNANR